MRIVEEAQYSKGSYSDESNLYAFKGLGPVALSKGITYLYGRGSNAFPLLYETMTNNKNGVRSIKPLALNDSQFYVPTFGKLRTTTRCMGLVDTSITKPGIGGKTFEIYMGDSVAHNQQTLFSPDGKSQLRLQAEPTEVGANKYKARVSLYQNDSTSFVDPANFTAGKYWSVGPAKVPMSKSIGTASNSQSMGKMMSQFGLIRHSKHLAGNITNKVVNFELPLFDANGQPAGTTNQWMPFEMKLWELEIRRMEEDALWDSVYNRDASGQITTTDENTGEKVPSGPGVKQILTAGGRYDTFGSQLTLKKLDATVIQAINSSSYDSIKEIILYTGSGGARAFNNAVMNVSKGQPYFQSVGADFITANKDQMLTYGNYFNRYKTPDGVIITVQVSDYFNKSARAQMDIQNNNMVDGFPRFSYTMVALDHSTTNEGDRNINLVAEAGREVKYKVVLGMSDVPDSFAGMGANNSMQISRDADISSMEIMKSQGIAITDWSNCFWLEMAA